MAHYNRRTSTRRTPASRPLTSSILIMRAEPIRSLRNRSGTWNGSGLVGLALVNAMQEPCRPARKESGGEPGHGKERELMKPMDRFTPRRSRWRQGLSAAAMLALVVAFSTFAAAQDTPAAPPGR